MNATLKDVVAEIDKDILARLIRIDSPTFDAHADVAHEEVLEIDATAPGVIGLDVPVVYPIISREDIRAPKRDVKLSVRVPLGARRRSYLLHFFSRIGLSGKSDRSDRTER